MKRWLGGWMCWARGVAARIAAPVVRKADAHLGDVVERALAEHFTRLYAQSDQQAGRTEAAHGMYLEAAREANLLSDGLVRELARCGRRVELVEQRLDELLKRVGGVAVESAVEPAARPAQWPARPGEPITITPHRKDMP